MASASNPDLRVRIFAMEWIAKRGWPDESRGQTTVTGDGSMTTVTHVHRP
jgi:hypothetical protein